MFEMPMMMEESSGYRKVWLGTGKVINYKSSVVNGKFFMVSHLRGSKFRIFLLMTPLVITSLLIRN